MGIIQHPLLLAFTRRRFQLIYKTTMFSLVFLIIFISSAEAHPSQTNVFTRGHPSACCESTVCYNKETNLCLDPCTQTLSICETEEAVPSCELLPSLCTAFSTINITSVHGNKIIKRKCDESGESCVAPKKEDMFDMKKVQEPTFVITTSRIVRDEL